MTAINIREKRAAAGIAGYAICQIVGIPRTRLSDIEREYVIATPEELGRIHAAIEGIIQTRRRLAKLAKDDGLSLTGVRL